jgi:hypothetical protein
MVVLTILLSGNERILPLKFDVHERSAYKNAAFTGSAVPAVFGDVVVRESAAVEKHSERFAFARAQRNLGKTLQFLSRARNSRMGISNIDLSILHASA